MIRGVLHSDDWVPNGDRRFGAATHYLWGVYERDGERKAFALTPAGLEEGFARAEANPEDHLPFESEAARAWRSRPAETAPTGRLLALASALIFSAGLLVGVWAGGWL
jgi:hypothetical protein